MTNLFEMLREAGVLQVIDWDLFRTYTKPAYFIEIEGTDTMVWVKWDHCISKYRFGFDSILKEISSETLECVA